MSAAWEPHKDLLHTLYILRGEKLKSIMAVMSEVHGFTMSKGQYERQFKKWGFCKNSKAASWGIVNLKLAQREKQGKKSIVRRDGEEISRERLVKERRHTLLSDTNVLHSGELPRTPEGFTVCTPQCDTVAVPPIFINNLPSLNLFSLLKLHIDPANVLFGRSNQEIVSRITGYDSEGAVQHASASVQCADWVRSFTGHRHSTLDIISDTTTFEIDIPSELSSVSRTGSNSRLLLSIIHSAANNLLYVSQASEMLSVVLQNSNRKIFQALIAGQSPATKAIARTFLAAAIESLDCSLVRALLGTGIDPNSYVNDSRQRPLQIAISKQTVEMTQLLLDLGADVSLHLVSDFSGDTKTPLEEAAMTGRLDLVQLLLDAGAEVNEPEPTNENSPLYIAARFDHSQLVQLLLDAGAKVNGLGYPALNAAVEAGNIEVVNLLLSHGAHVNARCLFRIHKPSALECAAHIGNVDITQILLSYGATDVVSALSTAGHAGHNHVVTQFIGSRSHPIVNDAFGRTALQAATHCADFELVHTLLDCGVSTDTPPTDGAIRWRTALQIAADQGDMKIAKLLISYGADINAPAGSTSHASYPVALTATTALQAAVLNDRMQLVQLLLYHGADVNAPAAEDGITALAAAASKGNLEMLRLLLDIGADMKRHGASAVIQAIGRVSLESLRSLLDTWKLASGGNLAWSVNENYETALEIAAQSNDVELTRILLEYGADDRSLALRRMPMGREVNIEAVELLLAWGAEVGLLDDDYDDDEEVTTTLEYAAIECADHPIALRLLLEHRNERLTTHEKSRALQAAAYVGNLNAARLLLDHGADVNAGPFSLFDDDNDVLLRTSLQTAAEAGHLKMVRFLLEAGADVESKTPSEYEQGTALQFAATAGSMSVVTVLIEEGADVRAPAIGDDGRTAIEGAAEHGRLDIVQLLLSLGVESAGSLAIQFAREEGHDGVVALLQEAGWEENI